MLKDRLIFTLLLQNGKYMLSRNFTLQEVGDLSWIKENYDVNSILYSIDELIVLNVARDDKNVDNFTKYLSELVFNCFMPVAAGGGVRNEEDAYKILNAGADKIVVNSMLVENKQLVKSLVKLFGSQCIVASIDYKDTGDEKKVFINNGSVNSNLSISEAVQNAIDLEVGEIFLNSINLDGTGQGLDLDIIKDISQKSPVPVIASGGVGRIDQFTEGIKKGHVKAVSTADLFNFMCDSLSLARKDMIENCNMAEWDMPLFISNNLK